MAIVKDKVTITGDTSTVYSRPYAGLVHGFYAENGTLGAGTDIVISDPETGMVILTITNLAADKLYMPRALNQDLAGADTAIRERIPINGAIRFVTSGAGASTAGTIWVYVDTSGD